MLICNHNEGRRKTKMTNELMNRMKKAMDRIGGPLAVTR